MISRRPGTAFLFGLLRTAIAALEFGSDRSRSLGYAHGRSPNSALYSRCSRGPKSSIWITIPQSFEILRKAVGCRDAPMPDSPGAGSGRILLRIAPAIAWNFTLCLAPHNGRNLTAKAAVRRSKIPGRTDVVRHPDCAGMTPGLVTPAPEPRRWTAASIILPSSYRPGQSPGRNCRSVEWIAGQARNDGTLVRRPVHPCSHAQQPETIENSGGWA